MLLTILSVLIGAIAGIALFLSAMGAATMVLYSCNENPDPKEEWGFAKFAFRYYVVALAGFGLLFFVLLMRGGA